MDTRVQRKDGETDTYTRDVQQAVIKYTLNYRLQQNAAHLVYRDVGREWEHKLVPQVVLGTLKEVVGKWDAVDLIANRDKAGRQRSKIQRQPRQAQCGSLKIRDHRHHLHQGIRELGGQKVIAQQRAIEEQNRTKQIEEQARQKVLSAEAEAKSMQICAEALNRTPSWSSGSGAEMERRVAAVHARRRRHALHQPEPGQELRNCAGRACQP